MARNPDIYSVTLSLSLKDEDPKIAEIAKMFKDGLAIDQNNFHKLKGKDLLIFALKDFHKRWVEEKKEEIKIPDKEPITTQNPVKKTRNFGSVIDPIGKNC